MPGPYSRANGVPSGALGATTFRGPASGLQEPTMRSLSISSTYSESQCLAQAPCRDCCVLLFAMAGPGYKSILETCSLWFWPGLCIGTCRCRCQGRSPQSRRSRKRHVKLAVRVGRLPMQLEEARAGPSFWGRPCLGGRSPKMATSDSESSA